MIKKIVVAAIAASALSIPLAGVAWGDDFDGGGDGLGAGGVPVKIAEALERNGGPVVDRVIPGTGAEPNIYGSSDLAKLPGSIRDTLGPLNPGSFIKAVTPGCESGSLGCQ